MQRTFILILTLLCSSCGILVKELGIMGGATSTSAATETTYSTYEVLEAAKTGADIVVYSETGKTTTDIALSEITQKDCKFFDCKERSVEEIFLNQPRVKRITGQSCGTRMYSDWPCMEAEGCIILE